MSFLFECIVFVLGLFMFHLDMKYKLSLFIFTTICLDPILISFVPFGFSKSFLSICFFLSEFSRIRSHLGSLRQTVIYPLLIMMVIASFILLIYSPHYHSLKDGVRLFVVELIVKYFAIAYGFLCIKEELDLKPAANAVYVGMIMLTFWGIQNLVTRDSIWLGMIIDSDNYPYEVQSFSNQERFRVQSMFVNPFFYGYICALYLIFVLYLFFKEIITKDKLLVVLAGSLFGIITCGSRAVMLASIIGTLSFFIFYLDKRNRKILLLGLTIVSFFSISYLMASNSDYVDNILKAFNTDTYGTGGDGYGSNIGMRLVQLGAVLYYISDNPLFGRGKDFFLLDMGFSDISAGTGSFVDNDLWGLEGIYLDHLLERGFVGLFFWFAFYTSVFIYFLKRKKAYKIDVAFGIALIALYVSFTSITGDLNSVFPTLLLIGVTIGITKLNLQKEM